MNNTKDQADKDVVKAVFESNYGTGSFDNSRPARPVRLVSKRLVKVKSSRTLLSYRLNKINSAAFLSRGMQPAEYKQFCSPLAK